MTSTVADHHHDEVPKGITRWLFTTNHKDIGTLYLWFAFIMFLVGGAMSLIIRAELFQPGLQIINPHFFQPDDHRARAGDGIRCGDAGLCGFLPTGRFQ